MIANFHQFVFFLGIPDKNDTTPEWIFKNSPALANHGSKLCMVAWIHSHVRGNGCFFSSVDVHTHYQFSQSLGLEGFLGMVFQITETNKLKKYDAFDLTSLGIKSVAQCGREKNLSHQLHPKCDSSTFYMSRLNSITILSSLNLEISNFFDSCPPEQINSLPEIAMEVDDGTQDIPSLVTKQCLPLANERCCRGCEKEFKSVLIHISRSKGPCKEKYSDEERKLMKSRNKKKSVQNYNQNNKKIIAKKQKKRDIANRNKKQEYNKKNQVNINTRQKQYYVKNKEKIDKRHHVYDAKHKKEKMKHNTKYYKDNREKLVDKAKKNQQQKKENYTAEDRLKDFTEEIKDGPIHVCLSCDRCMFKRGVKFLTEKSIIKLFEKCPEKLIHEATSYRILKPWSSKLRRKKVVKKPVKKILCQNCYQSLYYHKKIPRMSTVNGLWLDTIPKELKLTDLEEQLIALNMLFLKIFKLPKGMVAVKDRVINVPLEAEDIAKTVTALPRKFEDSKLIPVNWKRKLSMAGSHIQSYIRADALPLAVEKLKTMNPHYAGVDINENFCIPEEPLQEMNNEDMMEIVDEFAKDQEKPDVIKEKENSEAMDVDANSEKDPMKAIKENDEDSDEEIEILGAVKEHQSDQNSHTCMTRMEPESWVVENHGSETITKKRSSKTKTGIDIAPGENKIPTNYMRDTDFDVKAFPTLHPTGSYGLNHPRDQKLPPVYYFNQRLLNVDQRFAKRPPYLFAAQQYVERTTLEAQINISGLKGNRDSTTTNMTTLTDPFSVFQKLKGSPRYWKQAKDELIAKVKQLGPFHVFFTLSCAELRWAEIFVSILTLMGVKVIHGNVNGEWNGKDDEIYVNGKPLWTFISEMKDPKYKLLNNQVLLITRMFDNRVKSFIKNILMGSGKGKLPFQYYSYRIEFQARGLPHIHAVAWFKREEFLDLIIGEKTTLQESNKTEEIIKEIVQPLITCEIPNDDEELKEKVLQLQVHKHTNTCRKHGTVCRFGFPRYPSDKTQMAEPAENHTELMELDAEKRKEVMAEYKSILEKVKNALQDENLDDNQSLKDFLS